MDNNKKETIIVSRITTKEKERIRRKAHENYMTMSEYMRTKLLK